MVSAFPHQPPVDYAPRRRTNVVVDSDDQTDVLQVLSSETAQAILGVLRDDPKTASDVATAIEMSLQSVSYHLNRLCDANLVSRVGTWYSEKGKEMTVYALATEQLVIQFDEYADRAPSPPPDRSDRSRSVDSLAKNRAGN